MTFSENITKTSNRVMFKQKMQCVNTIDEHFYKQTTRKTNQKQIKEKP